MHIVGLVKFNIYIKKYKFIKIIIKKINLYLFFFFLIYNFFIFQHKLIKKNFSTKKKNFFFLY
jgi:hypothetical protein